MHANYSWLLMIIFIWPRAFVSGPGANSSFLTFAYVNTKLKNISDDILSTKSTKYFKTWRLYYQV